MILIIDTDRADEQGFMLMKHQCNENGCARVKANWEELPMPDEQIPKKPIDDSYPWVICPTCGGSVFTKHIIEHIQNKETTYCEHCGQAIDWRTTE